MTESQTRRRSKELASSASRPIIAVGVSASADPDHITKSRDKEDREALISMGLSSFICAAARTQEDDAYIQYHNRT
jgi:hypothetical protein